MKKAELEPRLVAGAEPQFRRYRKVERAGFGLQFFCDQIQPGQLDPVHRNDLHTEHGLTRHAGLAWAAAKIEAIGAGRQLPIGSENPAAARFAAATRRAPPPPALPDRRLLEAVEHAPLPRRPPFLPPLYINRADDGLGADRRHQLPPGGLYGMDFNHVELF